MGVKKRLGVKGHVYELKYDFSQDQYICPPHTGFCGFTVRRTRKYIIILNNVLADNVT